jgi:hypothetical protein
MEDDLPYLADDEEQPFRFEIFNRSSKYFVGDVVMYNGAIYTAFRDSEGETPDHNPDAWVLESAAPRYIYDGWGAIPLAVGSYNSVAANNPFLIHTTSDTSFNSSYYTSAGTTEASSSEVHELRAAVEQLRREIAEIKERLNTAEAAKNIESYRKIAVQ